MSDDNENMDGTIQGFERDLAEQDGGFYNLTLYVTGHTPRSIQAIASIRALCEGRLKGRYKLHVIDLYQEPQLAEQAQIIATPTLIRQLPLPLRRLVGDMSNEEKVLLGLGLTLVQ